MRATGTKCNVTSPTPSNPFAWITDAPFYQAGLAGYSDEAMRRVARRHGCPYCVTEAMLDVFLVNGGKGLKAAELHDEDHPIAGQLMGSHPAEIAAGAEVLVGLGYDVIDVNLACPVKKIKKKARGGHLLSVPDEAVAILDAVRQAVDPAIPCTVKLRRAYDDSAEAESNFRRIFEAAIERGYAGATVHSRTVEQKYLGPGYRPFLKQLVEDYGRHEKGRTSRDREGAGHLDWGPARSLTVAARQGNASSHSDPAPDTLNPKPFLIGGSGDVWCAADILAMLRDTGVDMVSVARGCIGNPWVFTQARALMRGEPAPPPTLHQQRDVLRDHFALSVGLHEEKQASKMMRKFGIRFARHHPRADEVKQAFIRVSSLSDWSAVLDGFYATDGPGIDALPDEAASSQTACGLGI